VLFLALAELPDLQRCRFVYPPVAPFDDDPPPVGGVCAAGAGRDGRGELVDVLAERRHARASVLGCGGGEKLLGGDSHPSEQ
jgi:hypothetical protein